MKNLFQSQTFLLWWLKNCDLSLIYTMKYSEYTATFVFEVSCFIAISQYKKLIAV